MIDKKSLAKGIGIMRHFPYGVSQILKITMAAAGGVLILALAGQCKIEWEPDYMREGLSVIFRLSYPGASEETWKNQEAESWEERFVAWLGRRQPRVRFEQSRERDAGLSGDPDPSFERYAESQRVVKESSYLLFGGGEETGSDKADLAGVTAEGQVDYGAASGVTESIGVIQNFPQTAAVHHINRELPIAGTSYVMEQLADYDFLMKHFYSVHSSTTAGRDEMDAAKLLREDLSIDKSGEGPQILIYHTHSQETYADYGPEKPEATVIGIGDYLTELLEAKGYDVIHDKKVYDFIDGELNRSKAYDYALAGITGILQEYPSIQVILDVHRDGVREDLHMVSEVNGKPTAPIMFFNGMSQTPEGPIEYLPNPYKEQNLAFSLQMQIDAAAYFPGFTRKIYLKGFRYNLHLRPRSALIEVGAQTNTYEEARNAMEPLAELLDLTLTNHAK